MDIRPDYANVETADGVARVKPEQVAVGDTIVVNQVGSSNTIFRSSNEMTYEKAETTENTEGTETSDIESQNSDSDAQ